MLRPLAIKINKVQHLRFPINILLNSSIDLPIIQRCSLEQQKEEKSALQKALGSLKEIAKPESSATRYCALLFSTSCSICSSSYCLTLDCQQSKIPIRNQEKKNRGKRE